MKTITAKELIKQLQDIIEKDPKKADVGVFVYISEVDALLDDGESPNPISLVDDSISDRIDLNI